VVRVAGNPSRAHAHAFGAAASPTGNAVVRVIVSDLTVYAHDRASLAGCVAARDGDGRRIWPTEDAFDEPEALQRGADRRHRCRLIPQEPLAGRARRPVGDL
jgi:hypothetical protein